MIKKIKGGLYIGGGPGSYRVVYPIKKCLEKPFHWDNIHWKNLLLGGSWKRLGLMFGVVALILFFAGTYYLDTMACRRLIEKPCMHCLTDRCLDNFSKVEGASLIYRDDLPAEVQGMVFVLPDDLENMQADILPSGRVLPVDLKNK